MPDDVVAGEIPESPTPPEADTPEEEWGPEFDADRARALIARLRQEARTVYKERPSAKMQRELDALKAEKKQRDQAALSDLERAQQRADQAEADLQATKHQAAERELDHAIERGAASLGIIDPSAARLLLDRAALEFDGDGRPTNVPAVLKQLLRDRPYLGGQAPAPTGNPATRAAAQGKPVFTRAQIKDSKFYSAHRDEILDAMRNGRLVD